MARKVSYYSFGPYLYLQNIYMGICTLKDVTRNLPKCEVRCETGNEAGHFQHSEMCGGVSVTATVVHPYL